MQLEERSGPREVAGPGDTPGPAAGEDPHPRHQHHRRETAKERDDRNFQELLQELRVTQTGVQILFAFLLTLAFTQRFEDLDSFQIGVYVVTLLLAVTATVNFTAPAAMHRVLFRQGAKRSIVETSTKLVTTGLVALSLAFTGALLLVVDVATGERGAGVAAAAGALVMCTSMWGALPHLIKRGVVRSEQSAEQEPDAGRSGPSHSPRPARTSGARPNE